MLQNIERNAPRDIRVAIRRSLTVLFLLSPKQAGDTQWRFGAQDENGTMILLGKGVPNRDKGRAVAVERFGVKARELRPKSKQVAA